MVQWKPFPGGNMKYGQVKRFWQEAGLLFWGARLDKFLQVQKGHCSQQRDAFQCDQTSSFLVICNWSCWNFLALTTVHSLKIFFSHSFYRPLSKVLNISSALLWLASLQGTSLTGKDWSIYHTLHNWSWPITSYRYYIVLPELFGTSSQIPQLLSYPYMVFCLKQVNMYLLKKEGWYIFNKSFFHYAIKHDFPRITQKKITV